MEIKKYKPAIITQNTMKYIGGLKKFERLKASTGYNVEEGSGIKESAEYKEQKRDKDIEVRLANLDKRLSKITDKELADYTILIALKDIEDWDQTQSTINELEKSLKLRGLLS